MSRTEALTNFLSVYNPAAEAALAAADEVHDLEAVAGFNTGVLPAVAGQDFQVALDGDSLEADPQMPEQAGNGQPGRDLTLFSIDYDGDGAAHFLEV